MTSPKSRWSSITVYAPALWPATIVFLTAASGVVTLGDIASPLRPLVALPFLLLCPGMAFVRLLRIRDPLIELTLAIALSLAIDAIVATVMLYVGAWSPKGGLIVLLCLTLGGIAIQITIAYSRLFRRAMTDLTR